MQPPPKSMSTRTEMRPVKYDFADSILCTYVVSVISANIAELATYPLDLTKTRLQIQGEAAASRTNKIHVQVPYRGMVATARGIISEEGFFKLWQGFSLAMCRHCISSGCRMTIYNHLRNNFGSTGKEPLAMWKSVLFGATAGSIGQWLATPMDLVKVQMQTEGKRRLLGLEPRVHGGLQTLKDIVKRGGVTGLWKGGLPSVQRAALVTIGDFSGYDLSKHFILRNTTIVDGTFLHVISAMIAGITGALLSTPADVIKTRVMNQPTDEKGRGLLYKGSVDCLMQAVRHEGFFSLYKGFMPCWMRLGPWALIFWVSYERISYVIGATSF